MGRPPSDNPWVGVTPQLGRLIRQLAAKRGQTETTYLEAVFAEELSALPPEPKAGQSPNPAEKWMRLVVDRQTHRRVKHLAALAGMSMGDWVKAVAGRDMAKWKNSPAGQKYTVGDERDPDSRPAGPE